MTKSVDKIVEDADWKELTPGLLYFADSLIQKCPWRGIPVSARAGVKLCVDGYGADDVLQDAVDRLLAKRRAYDHSVSLEQNLRRAIRSIIWSMNKASRRTPLIDITSFHQENADPMQQLPSTSPSADTAAIAAEEAVEQQRILGQFEISLVDDGELLSLVVAYKDGLYKPREIEKLSGISASRISELKRKLHARMERFEAGFVRRDSA